MITFGLLDSGLSENLAARAALARRFHLDDSGDVVIGPPEADSLGHGTALAGLVLDRVPSIRLMSAQVFDRRGIAAPAVIAAGLDWLVSEAVQVVNMSFGLMQDRRVLSAACRRAVEAGVLVVASVPAMGPVVYPASYAGIVRVTGDARCGDGEISYLGGPRAHFGARPWLPGGGAAPGAASIAGASVASARVAAELAALWATAPERGGTEMLTRMVAAASPLGPQREHLCANRAVREGRGR